MARDCLFPEIDESVKQFKIERELRKIAAQRKSSAQFFDPVEDWLYWLISAAALISLLLEFLCLLDFTNQQTQSIGIKQSGQAEGALSGGGDPDSTGKSLIIRPVRLTLPRSLSQPSE